ncbi:hypothetical protein DLAC_09518 [Tieghemostelium lacteum]|uniref:Uncharacterized protein n=1 Tax=Tieghemostelium lacteum TaxID=361077 RepID=A0A151Z6H5_TIELA|nr:hypothetical protein DLAC_09518 [Tieghemostelium lacteum]|eukprot:KYQ89566.1 hypothetical protein DLAC_09518 [Tieghemostelium lacteum]
MSNNNNNNIRKSSSEHDIDLYSLTSSLSTISDFTKLVSARKNTISFQPTTTGQQVINKSLSFFSEKTPEEIDHENLIISQLDKEYFEEEFDSGYILNQIPSDSNIDLIDQLTVKISTFHEVVDSRFNDLIRKSYNGFVQGMSQVYEIEKDLTHSAVMCQSGKSYLSSVSRNLTSYGFIILAKHRTRQVSKFILEEMNKFREIGQVSNRIDTLMNNNEFSSALVLMNQWDSVIGNYQKYHCIRELAQRFHSTTKVIIDRIDCSFLEVCHQFQRKQFENIIDGYVKLNQSIRFRDKIHQNFILNIEDHSKKILKTHLQLSHQRPEELGTMKFIDMCKLLKEDQYVTSLLAILEHLSDLMFSHYQMKNCVLELYHSGMVESNPQEAAFYLDIFKLMCTNRKPMWNTIQNQVKHLLSAFNPKFKIEEFLQVLESINQFIQVGREFSQEEANLLRMVMKEKSLAYFEHFHKDRIEDLKTMLENEMWHKVPLPNNFSVLDIKEFGIVIQNTNHNNSNNNHNNNNIVTEKPILSPFLTLNNLENQKTSLELKDHNIEFLNQFKENGNPFSIKLKSKKTLSQFSNITDDQLNNNNSNSNNNNNNSNNQSSPLISSTTINVIRLIGKYLQMMKILNTLSYPIFTAISQLLEYYVYSIYGNFFNETTQQQQQFDNNNNINPMLKKTMTRLKQKFNHHPSSSNTPTILQTSSSLLSSTNIFQNKLTASPLSLRSSSNIINNSGSNSSNKDSDSKDGSKSPGLASSFSSSSTNANGSSWEHDEISINWKLPKKNEHVDTQSSKSLYGLEYKVIALESMMFLVDGLMEAQSLVLSLVPQEKIEQIRNFYIETVSVVASLRNYCYKNLTSQLLNIEQIYQIISNQKWELKEAPTMDSGSYVSHLIIEFHRFTGLLDEISNRTGILTPKVKNLLWENIITHAMETLIEAYSRIKKCNNYGRNLMIMDLKKLQSGLESLTTIRPIPHIQHVDKYITAFYLPETDLYNLARDSEFTPKQVLSIVNIIAHLKKPEKQKLISDIEKLEKENNK